MESPLSPVRMHWDHEPESGPLTPSLSPSEGGEGAQPICTLPFTASETLTSEQLCDDARGSGDVCGLL